VQRRPSRLCAPLQGVASALQAAAQGIAGCYVALQACVYRLSSAWGPRSKHPKIRRPITEIRYKSFTHLAYPVIVAMRAQKPGIEAFDTLQRYESRS
jgi:hypothetical protein